MTCVASESDPEEGVLARAARLQLAGEDAARFEDCVAAVMEVVIEIVGAVAGAGAAWELRVVL